MATLNSITLNGVEYKFDSADLKSEMDLLLKGGSISYSETLSGAQTVFKYFDKIPSGTEILVENKSSNTPVNIAFRDSENTEITARETVNGGYSTVITLPDDAYSIRFYVNGTEFKIDLTYGDNIIGQMAVITDMNKISVGLNDGYYSAGGAVVAPSSTYAEKYTDKLPVFEGMKLVFSVEFLTAGHLAWAAVNEWSKTGTFVRTSLDSPNAKKNSYTYEPSENAEYVSFSFRGYNDYSLTISVASNAYDVFTAINEQISDLASAGGYSYAFDADGVKGINHRGFNQTAPENTIPAYKLSVENGFKFVETDLRFTSDNVPVLLHDATVDRTSNGSGNISSMTFAQARALDFGSWKSSAYAGTQIPSLEEFIVFCKQAKVYPYIELSGEYTEAQLNIAYNIVKQYSMTKAVTWIGSNTSALNIIKGLDAHARIGLITWGEATQNSVTLAKALMTGQNQVFLDLDITYASTAVSIAKAAGIPLELWTSNSADAMKAIDPYVNGITSDNTNYETVIKEYALS